MGYRQLWPLKTKILKKWDTGIYGLCEKLVLPAHTRDNWLRKRDTKKNKKETRQNTAGK